MTRNGMIFFLCFLLIFLSSCSWFGNDSNSSENIDIPAEETQTWGIDNTLPPISDGDDAQEIETSSSTGAIIEADEAIWDDELPTLSLTWEILPVSTWSIDEVSVVESKKIENDPATAAEFADVSEDTPETDSNSTSWSWDSPIEPQSQANESISEEEEGWLFQNFTFFVRNLVSSSDEEEAQDSKEETIEEIVVKKEPVVVEESPEDAEVAVVVPAYVPPKPKPKASTNTSSSSSSNSNNNSSSNTSSSSNSNENSGSNTNSNESESGSGATSGTGSTTGTGSTGTGSIVETPEVDSAAAEENVWVDQESVIHIDKSISSDFTTSKWHTITLYNFIEWDELSSPVRLYGRVEQPIIFEGLFSISIYDNQGNKIKDWYATTFTNDQEWEVTNWYLYFAIDMLLEEELFNGLDSGYLKLSADNPTGDVELDNFVDISFSFWELSTTEELNTEETEAEGTESGTGATSTGTGSNSEN